MPDKKQIRNYSLRASIPALLRYAGIAGTIIAVFAVGIGFYIATSEDDFRSGDFPAELSEKVVGIVNGYQRKESKDGVLKYFITADTAKTFDDNHQELDNVAIRVYKDGDVEIFDKISADRAVYVPAKTGKHFTVFFAGDVLIKTHTELEINTDQLSYKSESDIARAEEAVSFKRYNISGKSFGAVVEIGKRTLELSKEVEIYATKAEEEGETGVADLKLATLKSGYAFVEGDNEIIRLRNGVKIALTPDSNSSLKQPSDIHSSNALVFFQDREIKRVELEGNVDVTQRPTIRKPDWLRARAQRAVAFVDVSVERLNLFDGLTIETKKNDEDPVVVRSDSGHYERAGQVFELNDNVEIITNRNAEKVRATGAHAIYRQEIGKLLLDGGAEISQSRDFIKGDAINAELTGKNLLKYAKATNNANLRQVNGERVTDVKAETLEAWFLDGQKLSKAAGRGKTLIEVFPSSKQEYSRFRLSTPKGIDLAFNRNGFVSESTTIGRTTLHLDAGSDGKSASDKTLTADTVKTSFRPNNNELAQAHAIGNAELVIVPKKNAAGQYRSIVKAPRFDCDFYPGNSAKSCSSTNRSRLVRKSVNGNKKDQALDSNRLVSHFDRKTKEVRLFEAVGNSKFSEGPMNGVAENIDYLPLESKVALRGGSPTVWDNKARAKAEKIDWNTERDESVLSGGVSTTYFNQKQTGNSAPFTDANSPVYLTADSARFDHVKRTGVYVGNARAWQDKNYVRGDRIYIEEIAGRFYADGKVQSVVYEAKRGTASKPEKAPVFVASGTMLYQRDKRQIRYEKNVDIRQGPERIVGRAADVYLNAENTLTKTVVTGNVVITQPNRKATGDYASYDAVEETVELRGNPATFSDRETGVSNGKILSVDLKNNTAVNSGSTTRMDTGRIRSVYKVKEGRVN